VQTGIHQQVRLAAQAIVQVLFHHSLIKLYTEGDLTSIENNGGMGARKITKAPKQHQSHKRIKTCNNNCATQSVHHHEESRDDPVIIGGGANPLRWYMCQSRPIQ
jgi:hypothetical protein